MWQENVEYWSTREKRPITDGPPSIALCLLSGWRLNRHTNRAFSYKIQECLQQSEWHASCESIVFLSLRRINRNELIGYPNTNGVAGLPFQEAFFLYLPCCRF